MYMYMYMCTCTSKWRESVIVFWQLWQTLKRVQLALYQRCLLSCISYHISFTLLCWGVVFVSREGRWVCVEGRREGGREREGVRLLCKLMYHTQTIIVPKFLFPHIIHSCLFITVPTCTCTGIMEHVYT